MSLLTTQQMRAIATEEKQKKAELAFRVSGMATVLSEKGKKDKLVSTKVSQVERDRWNALADKVELPISSIIRTTINQLCDQMGVQ